MDLFGKILLTVVFSQVIAFTRFVVRKESKFMMHGWLVIIQTRRTVCVCVRVCVSERERERGRERERERESLKQD